LTRRAICGILGLRANIQGWCCFRNLETPVAKTRKGEIMTDQLLSPEDVAGQLNISPSTLELWCITFSGHLSKWASPREESAFSDAERLFTEEDMAVLARAKQLVSREVSSVPRSGPRAH
jgi:hypothetical protein